MSVVSTPVNLNLLLVYVLIFLLAASFIDP